MLISIKTDFQEVERMFNSLSNVEAQLVTIIDRALTICETRAKEILTEKGHIVTGALRRSIISMITKIANDIIEGYIGSPMNYAYYVERLPDGGYLFPALESTFNRMVNYMVTEIRKIL